MKKQFWQTCTQFKFEAIYPNNLLLCSKQCIIIKNKITIISRNMERKSIFWHEKNNVVDIVQPQTLSYIFNHQTSLANKFNLSQSIINEY